jgi:hypothetical protein
MADQAPGTKDVPTRLLDWTERQGIPKLLRTPISIPAAVGGALVFVENNWLTFFAVVGAFTCGRVTTKSPGTPGSVGIAAVRVPSTGKAGSGCVGEIGQ